MNAYSYQLYEMTYAALAPTRALSSATRLFMDNPFNPLRYTPMGMNITASAEMWERMTRRYAKPSFDLPSTVIGDSQVPVHENVIWERPLCRLVHFARELPLGTAPQPKLLIVAPMSGHFATLLRGTVEAFLPHCDVYITDWADARHVPLAAGRFDLDDYIDYLIEMIRHLGPDVHAIGVCQPAVPLIAAVARMEAENDPFAPASMILMGGPIDTRRSPTEVNKLAETRGVDWFRSNCLVPVPLPYLGAGRMVYPGFLQLSGFMAMNLDRHLIAHLDMFGHLVQGDGDSAEKHRDFYDEYLSVMDLTAEYYMQTIETVFVEHALPKGKMMHRDKPVDLGCIRRTALMTVEGENDDISGVGQTRAAHDLCVNLPDDKKVHYVQENVGHYGVFNGSRFRSMIAPRIREFMAAGGRGAATVPTAADMRTTRQVATPLLATSLAATSLAATPGARAQETVAQLLASIQ